MCSRAENSQHALTPIFLCNVFCQSKANLSFETKFRGTGIL